MCPNRKAFRSTIGIVPIEIISRIIPPTPVAVENPACFTTGTTISVPAAPGGTEYYWEGTNEFGTLMTDNASSPYAISTTGTYYVRAFETSSQCWSDAAGRRRSGPVPG